MKYKYNNKFKTVSGKEWSWNWQAWRELDITGFLLIHFVVFVGLQIFTFREDVESQKEAAEREIVSTASFIRRRRTGEQEDHILDGLTFARPFRGFRQFVLMALRFSYVWPWKSAYNHVVPPGGGVIAIKLPLGQKKDMSKQRFKDSILIAGPWVLYIFLTVLLSPGLEITSILQSQSSNLISMH